MFCVPRRFVAPLATSIVILTAAGCQEPWPTGCGAPGGITHDDALLTTCFDITAPALASLDVARRTGDNVLIGGIAVGAGGSIGELELRWIDPSGQTISRAVLATGEDAIETQQPQVWLEADGTVDVLATTADWVPNENGGLFRPPQKVRLLRFDVGGTSLDETILFEGNGAPTDRWLLLPGPRVLYTGRSRVTLHGPDGTVVTDYVPADGEAVFATHWLGGARIAAIGPTRITVATGTTTATIALGATTRIDVFHPLDDGGLLLLGSGRRTRVDAAMRIADDVVDPTFTVWSTNPLVVHDMDGWASFDGSGARVALDFVDPALPGAPLPAATRGPAATGALRRTIDFARGPGGEIIAIAQDAGDCAECSQLPSAVSMTAVADAGAAIGAADLASPCDDERIQGLARTSRGTVFAHGTLSTQTTANAWFVAIEDGLPIRQHIRPTRLGAKVHALERGFLVHDGDRLALVDDSCTSERR